MPLFQKATNLDRKFPDAQLALGDCLIQTKQFDKGVAALVVGLGWGDKVKPRFLTALGRAEEARDSLRSAGIYFTQARQQAPDECDDRTDGKVDPAGDDDRRHADRDNLRGGERPAGSFRLRL